MNSPKLSAIRSDLRRAIAARRRPLAAICAALAVVTGISAARPASLPTEPVMVAARDLAAGTQLEAADVTTVSWRPDSVPDGALLVHDPPLGQRVAAPMRAGEPFTDARLLQPGLLTGYPEGSVLATLRVADPAAGTVIRAGDVVDIVGADPQGRDSAMVVASGVPIISMPVAPAEATTVSDGLVLVVAVDHRTALRLADATVRQQLSVLVT